MTQATARGLPLVMVTGTSSGIGKAVALAFAREGHPLLLVHADVADSLDAYYQEIGRAGRDGEPAQAVLCYRPEDLGLRRFFAAGAPPNRALLYEIILRISADGTVRRAELEEQLGLSRRALSLALACLRDAGAVSYVGDRRTAARAFAGVLKWVIHPSPPWVPRWHVF